MITCGFGVSDITAKVGCSRTGSYRRRVMSGVHDPLLASACVIERAKTAVALVGIDAGVILRASADAARDAIARQTGIASQNIIISASHTHQGGPVLSTFQAEADPEYAKVVSRGIIDAVKQAWEKRSSCKVGAGTGKVTGIHFNRRFLMRDGREVTHPGKLHADIVRAAGPIDPKVGVLAIADSEGKVLGVVVNFGCHCTVTEEGTEYSADYVHYLREHLRRLLGDVAVIFLQGACGDVTQVDNQSPGVEKGHGWADMMGATLAGEVARVVKRVQWEDEPVIATAGERVRVAVREGDGCETPRLGLGSGEFWEEMYAQEKPHVARMRQEQPIVECEICGIRIGELAMVSNGGELFCAPSLEIQEASGFQKTWVVTLANEYVGYLTTAKAFYAGGYEVRTARSSFLDVTAAQKIVEGSLKVLSKLKL